MVIAALALGMLLTVGDDTSVSERAAAEARELRSFCHDNEFPDNMAPRGFLGLRFLNEYGKSGREAVLRLARERNRDGDCALDILVVAGDPGAVPIARELLADQRAPIFMRSTALAAVGKLKDTRSFDRVLAAFRSRHRDLVGPAAYALGELHDPRGWAELAAALEQPTYRAFWHEIVSSMAQPGRDDVVPLIVQAVAERKVSAGSGCSALWKIGTGTARQAAMPMLDSEPPVTREVVARSLRAALLQKSGPDAPAVAADVAALDKIIEQAKRQRQ